MKYSTDFKDYKDTPKSLIGKTVLVEYGKSYGGMARSISTIVAVTKTSFKIESAKTTLFSLENGKQRGLNSRMDMAIISRCVIITKEKADELKKVWKYNQEKRILLEAIKIAIELKETLNKTSKETLEEITKLLNITL